MMGQPGSSKHTYLDERGDDRESSIGCNGIVDARRCAGASSVGESSGCDGGDTEQKW